MNDNAPLSLLRPLRIDADALQLEPLALSPEAFQSPLPVQHYHLVFEDAAIGLAVGVWDTTTMQETFGPYPGDEFITVLDGSFAMIDAGGRAVRGKAGESVTFRDGIPISWRQEGYLRKIYLTLNDPDGVEPEIASAEGGVRAFGPGRALAAPQGADGLAREELYRNDAGTMTVSHCAFPALDLPLAVSPTHMLIRVLRGAITLTGPSGGPETFGAGDHVFLPKGAACAWRVVAGTMAFVVDVDA